MPTRWLIESVWLGGPEVTPNVVIEVDNGVISDLSTDPGPGDIPLAGVALPGLVNAHSHAFHRALRGRTQNRGGDFWAWREMMYRVAGRLDPDSYEELATAVFIEMALAGITAVGEFHYLHHQPGGRRYDNPNEMGEALVRAARTAGIRIALLDAGYFTSGIGNAELDPVQTRFSDGSVDSWLERASEFDATYRHDNDVVIGLAPHSVRAVPASDLARLTERAPSGVPVHIHLSEQPAENAECLAATGLTPAGLLAETGVLGPDATLVHATHLSTSDVELIGNSGASVCYCTTTERDLADGIGPAASLLDAGARLCVGTDSHAVIDIFEESRGMEMHQRLATGRRGIISPVHLARATTVVGSRSLGFAGKGIQAGAPADFIVLDAESPRLAGLGPNDPIDHVLFSAVAADVSDVFVAGNRVVSHGSHPGWDQARTALRPL